MLRVCFIMCIVSISAGHGYFGSRQIPPVKNHYRIAQPKFELIKPRGFKVSIADEPGLEIFTFHGSINAEVPSSGTGAISGEIGRSKNGRWTYTNTDYKLQPGDTIHYWLFVQKNSVGYRKDNLKYYVPGEF